ncbi:hypothetical protein B0A69_01920 [Chryseobacterium shigense]|nr:hypothetical protein B0A69_01920 [Chryseobacterium shigense]
MFICKTIELRHENVLPFHFSFLPFLLRAQEIIDKDGLKKCRKESNKRAVYPMKAVTKNFND